MSLFDSPWFRYYLIGVVAAAVLAVVITVAVVSPPPPPVTAPPPVKEEPLKLSDFLIEDPVDLESQEWQLMRPPRQKWEHEEIMKFWVDPVKLGIEKLGAENDRMVEEFFESVP